MKRFVRCCVLWLLVLALPMQGFAASTMLLCGAGHHGAAQAAEGVHDHGSHMHMVRAVWERSAGFRGAQRVFCDMSSPKAGLAFGVYDDMRERLIEAGTSDWEIAFAHDAETDTQKATLFKAVRDGRTRVLLGPTAKMGIGTNVQIRLVALHHLDAPWRPCDFEQRQGNECQEVVTSRRNPATRSRHIRAT